MFVEERKKIRIYYFSDPTLRENLAGNARSEKKKYFFPKKNPPGPFVASRTQEMRTAYALKSPSGYAGKSVKWLLAPKKRGTFEKKVPPPLFYESLHVFLLTPLACVCKCRSGAKKD